MKCRLLLTVSIVVLSANISCSSYDKDGYGRKIVESKKDVADDDDQFIDYIFVIRRRYGRFISLPNMN